jgi:NitT/TauT family transport system permease protein
VSKKDFLLVYVIPKVIGGIILGINVSIGIGWLCVVAAELIGTYSQGFWSGGLGYKLYIAHNNNDWYMVLTSLALFGILGIFSSTLWKLFVSSLFTAKGGFNPFLWLE